VVYGPVAGFVISSTHFVFPGFLVLGMAALMRDAGKATAIKVVIIAAVCAAFVLL
jgi:hypothetical protein